MGRRPFSASPLFPRSWLTTSTPRATFSPSARTGTTASPARTSALGESLERSRACPCGLTRAPWQLRRHWGRSPYTPATCWHYKRGPRQHGKPRRRDPGRRPRVFPALPDERPSPGSPAFRSPTSRVGATCRRPIASTVSRDAGPYFCQCDSKAVAACNTREEAIPGLPELWERDSVACGCTTASAARPVDVSSFASPMGQVCGPTTGASCPGSELLASRPNWGSDFRCPLAARGIGR